MARFLLVLLLITHALIHLAASMDAFGFLSIVWISGDPSRICGLFWLAASGLFLLSLLLILLKSPNWIWVATSACIISQVLILTYWKDAKLGSLVNLVVAAAAVFSVMSREINLIFRD